MVDLADVKIAVGSKAIPAMLSNRWRIRVRAIGGDADDPAADRSCSPTYR
jgi:hypothetical protein